MGGGDDGLCAGACVGTGGVEAQCCAADRIDDRALSVEGVERFPLRVFDVLEVLFVLPLLFFLLLLLMLALLPLSSILSLMLALLQIPPSDGGADEDIMEVYF